MKRNILNLRGLKVIIRKGDESGGSEPIIPNDETMQAMIDARNGKLTPVNAIGSLLNQLNEAE